MRCAFVLAVCLACPGLLIAAEKPVRPLGYGSLPPGAWACLGSPRFVGDKPIRSVAFSTDGKLLASGTGEYGTNGTDIHVWDLSTGQEVHTLRGHRQEIVALRFTPDSKRLVSAAWDNTLRVWDVAAGKEERQFVGHEQVITDLEMTPGGKQLVSSSQDGTLRVWDFASGKELRRMKCWSPGISLSPDGRTLAAASAGGVLLWDVETGEQLRRLGKGKVETTGVRGVRFAPDGKTLAVLDGGWQVSLWDVATATERLRLEGLRRPVGTLAFSPDGKVLATGGGGYENPGPFAKNFLAELKLWDVAGGKMLRSYEGHTFYVTDVAFAPDGRTLASAGGDFSTRLWDVPTGREPPRFVGHSHAVTSLAYTPDGGTVCSCSEDGTIRVWDARRCRERLVLRGHTKAVMALGLTPDGRTLASGGLDGTVRLWDLAAGREVRTLARDHGEVWCLAFSPDGRVLATGDRGWGGTGGTVRLWDWREGKEVCRPADQEGAHCLAFSPDGKTLAVGHHPNIWLREASTGNLREQLDRAHGEFVRSLAFLPDGTLVSAGTGDGVLTFVMRMWAAESKVPLYQLGTGRGYNGTMTTSPDGRLLAFAVETTVQVWETSKRRKVSEFRGQRGYIGALAFSPDGRTLASGGADGAILFWDLTGYRKDGRFATGPLEAQDLVTLWKDLAGEDGRSALWRLALSPEQSVPFLRQRLPVVPKVDPEHVRRLIAELDDEKFATREKAMRELGELGEAVAGALDLARKGKPPPEVAARVKRLLEQLESQREKERLFLPPSNIQLIRAVEALERADTPEAREVLQGIAAGEPSVRLTREARAALGRLARRQPGP
jgi:WD40 repeat protein